MDIERTQKKFRQFIHDSSIPGSLRILIIVYAILAFHFFLTFGLLSFLITANYRGAHFGLIFIALYSLVCFIVISLSIYPLWSKRFYPKACALLVSGLLVGYSTVWFYLGAVYVPLAFLFFILGAINGLFIMTGQAPSEYYKKTRSGLSG